MTSSNKKNPVKARGSHLCLIIHGLWGNPGHVSNIAKALRDRYSEDDLEILSPKTNSNTLTYDGIDLGAERVILELDEFFAAAQKNNKSFDRFSIVGYSLGGLIARFVIGILYLRGWFDEHEAVNFTTFATPHLGIKVPGNGFSSRFWNKIGSATLAASGRQLFLVDSFGPSRRPLLSVLADPRLVFIRALGRFQHRVAYANIVNDTAAPYYTTSLCIDDPFVNLDVLRLNYLPEYSPVILQPKRPFSEDSGRQTGAWPRFIAKTSQFAKNLPFRSLFITFLPVIFVVFVTNAGIQTVRSTRRVSHYSSGKSISDLEPQEPAELQSQIQAGESQEQTPSTSHENFDNIRTSSQHIFDLALAPEQIEMAKTLNSLIFDKYLIHIHKARRSHAAIIRRSNSASYIEGSLVLRHWVDHVFSV